jgi:hypothetical protein
MLAAGVCGTELSGSVCDVSNTPPVQQKILLLADLPLQKSAVVVMAELLLASLVRCVPQLL